MLMNTMLCACERSRIWRRNTSGAKNRGRENTGLLCGPGPSWSVSRSSAGWGQQRAVLARWRRAPCSLRERSVAGASGREAQLGLALQTFWARVKVAVRGDKRRYLQEHLDRAAEAADNGNVDEVCRLSKPWMKPHSKAPPRIRLDSGQWTRTPDQRRLQCEATFKGTGRCVPQA